MSTAYALPELEAFKCKSIKETRPLISLDTIGGEDYGLSIDAETISRFPTHVIDSMIDALNKIKARHKS